MIGYFTQILPEIAIDFTYWVYYKKMDGRALTCPKIHFVT